MSRDGRRVAVCKGGLESRNLPVQLRGDTCPVQVHFDDWVVEENGDVRRSKAHVATVREGEHAGVFSDGSKDWQEETKDVTTRVRPWVLGMDMFIKNVHNDTGL